MRVIYARYLIKQATDTVEKLRKERKRCPSNSSLAADDPKCPSGYQRTGHKLRRRQGSLHTLNQDTSNTPSGNGNGNGNGNGGGGGGSGP